MIIFKSEIKETQQQRRKKWPEVEQDKEPAGKL
jgi:hypothetical protein